MKGLPADAVERLHAAARAIRDGDAGAAQRLLHSVLADCPDHPEALRLLGILHLRSRRPDIARDLLAKALARNPDDAMLHNDLASARMACGEEEAAFGHWRRACELAPSEPMPWFNLGRNLQALGMGAEAIGPLQRACELAPGLLPATILLGDALLHLGQLEQAAARYRAALEVDPACGDAWRGLSNLRTHALTDADIDALQAQLRRADLGDPDRIAMGHALGRALEDRAAFAGAYSALCDANALQRKRAPWSARALLDFVDAALTATVALPEPLEPSLGSEAIFIVGLPRSGSTLFEQVLAAHPLVEGASELPDLGAIVQRESQRRGVAYPHWIPQASAADWQRLGREYMHATARWRSARPRFTDKMPENWKHAGILRAMLPGATVIETRRDPLETAWSCFRQQFMQSPHFSCGFDDIAACLRGCERAMDAWRGRDPQRQALFRYEDFVAAQEACTRALLDHCGLAFDPACLDFHRARRGVRTASAAQVRQPLRADTARAAGYGPLLDPLRDALARA
ncbi:MAG: sulfotransferase [Pseudomonadota bacterium]|nr:sulfotransferase [Pseudomonadota bacterium]